MSIKIKGKSVHAMRKRRHLRVRKKISGTSNCPRLVITRSLRHIFAQIVDDSKKITLASASTMEIEINGNTKTEKAKNVGKLIAKRVLSLEISSVVFDRGGYRYCGRVAAVADGAREGGLAL